MAVTKVRQGLDGNNWFEWQYNSSTDDLIIIRNPESRGNLVVRQMPLSIEDNLIVNGVIYNTGSFVTDGTVRAGGGLIAKDGNSGLTASGVYGYTANITFGIQGGLITTFSVA